MPGPGRDIDVEREVGHRADALLAGLGAFARDEEIADIDHRSDEHQDVGVEGDELTEGQRLTDNECTAYAQDEQDTQLRDAAEQGADERLGLDAADGRGDAPVEHAAEDLLAAGFHGAGLDQPDAGERRLQLVVGLGDSLAPDAIPPGDAGAQLYPRKDCERDRQHRDDRQLPAHPEQDDQREQQGEQRLNRPEDAGAGKPRQVAQVLVEPLHHVARREAIREAVAHVEDTAEDRVAGLPHEHLVAPTPGVGESHRHDRAQDAEPDQDGDVPEQVMRPEAGRVLQALLDAIHNVAQNVRERQRDGDADRGQRDYPDEAAPLPFPEADYQLHLEQRAGGSLGRAFCRSHEGDLRESQITNDKSQNAAL